MCVRDVCVCGGGGDKGHDHTEAPQGKNADLTFFSSFAVYFVRIPGIWYHTFVYTFPPQVLCGRCGTFTASSSGGCVSQAVK